MPSTSWHSGSIMIKRTTGFMSYESPPAETRQCNSCGKILSLNFFGLDSQTCRACEVKQRMQANETAQQPQNEEVQ